MNSLARRIHFGHRGIAYAGLKVVARRVERDSVVDSRLRGGRNGASGACFADVADPRSENARHDLLELLTIALCAVLCGAESCVDMAEFAAAKEPLLRQFLKLA